MSWTERPGRPQSTESQRVGHNGAQQSSSSSLGLRNEILASRKPLHSRQTGMVDHPLPPPKPSISISGTRLSQDSNSQNWPPVQTHPKTLRSFCLMSEGALSSTCFLSLPRDSSSPLDLTILNRQEPLPFPVSPISHSPLVHRRTSGNEVTAWKVCHL